MSPSRKPLVLGAAGCLLFSYALLYHSVVESLAHDWMYDDNFSHGFLIPPLAAYFAWERREQLSRAVLRPSVAGLVLVVLSILVLIAGTLGAELFLSRVSMIGVLLGVILFVGGWEHLRILAFPVLFLLLMVPIPQIVFNQVSFPLQLLASRVGEATLSGLGIPVLREGNVIVLANMSLEVAEACSGIRSLISLLALGVIFGYFVDPRTSVRVVLAVLTIPIAVVANALRVAGTGVAAHFFGRAAAEGFIHTFSGWLMFVFAFLVLTSAQRLLARLLPVAEPPAGAPPSAPA